MEKRSFLCNDQDQVMTFVKSPGIGRFASKLRGFQKVFEASLSGIGADAVYKLTTRRIEE
ncbi:hypothetical protein C7H09_18335 [Marinobacter fuscus]|uniref:Uncharacterized protein n=1 Tax=Marinobacter fuscus TaxID=2109942 RepID=A0A2T1K5E7_9GAMM|nr:hypothetical protein C7H09_18335 [Marinobacter fuscus]